MGKREVWAFHRDWASGLGQRDSATHAQAYGLRPQSARGGRQIAEEEVDLSPAEMVSVHLSSA